jgi:hypothetical protein
MTNYNELIDALADDEVKHGRIQMMIHNNREGKAIDLLGWRMIERIEHDAAQDGSYAALNAVPGVRLLRDILTAAGRRIMNP